MRFILTVQKILRIKSVKCRIKKFSFGIRDKMDNRATMTHQATENMGRFTTSQGIHYENFSARLKSFDNELVARKFQCTKMLTANRLSLAGFYYLGVDKKVACFSCNVILGMWTQYDDPFVEHAVHTMGRCEYMKGNGRKYVSLGLNSTPTSVAESESVVNLENDIQQQESVQLDAYKCVVCYTEIANVMTSPCNHISCCVTCFNRIEREDIGRCERDKKKCVVCRRKYDKSYVTFRCSLN